MYVYFTDNHYIIRKNAYNYAALDSRDLAEFVSDILIDIDWNLDEFPSILEFNNEFFIFVVIGERIRLVSSYSSYLEACKNYDADVEEFLENPNKSKCGAYIYENNNSSFSIVKSIGNKRNIFGSFKSLDDARFVKGILIDNNWNTDNLTSIYYNNYTNSYDIIGVHNGKIRILASFFTLDDAQNNLKETLMEFENENAVRDEPFIHRNGNYFLIQASDGKYWGTFRTFEDACSVRDFLVENNWDISKVDYQDIHEFRGFYWRFAPFKDYVKVVAKYYCFEDAFLNQNNLSDFSIKDLNNPDNPYSPVNRYIWKHRGMFNIIKRIDGELINFGAFKTKKEAIKARDEIEANNWVLNRDDESIFNENPINNFSAEISSLSLWQKLIYDTVDKMDSDTFDFDELSNHSNLRPYRRGNFKAKVQRYLDELIDLGFVDTLDDGTYRAMWK